MENDAVWQVIHLSTGHEGGAGLAARRLNSALNAAGISSSFWALRHNEYHQYENEFDIPRNHLTRLISRILSSIQSRLSQKVFFSLWSLNVLSNRRINKMGSPKDTILHFHNWFNLVSQKRITQLNKQGFSIVLTMHDERFMTGGCHYAFKCQGFQASCQKCPELPRLFKSIPSRNHNKFLKNAKNLSNQFALIAPSRWLRDKALSSSLISQLPVIFIPNTLGSNINYSVPLKQREILRQDSIIKIGIASMSKHSYIKGGDITSNLHKLVLERKLPIEIIYLSDFTNRENLTSDFWSQIDYLLVPSRADNSPNVIHEAKLLGIPVIASSIGGIAELLTPDFDVPIADELLNEEGILKILMGARHQDNRGLQNSMIIQFNEYVRDSVPSHIKVYEDLIKLKLQTR